MNVPPEPSLVDVVEGAVELLERLTEAEHYSEITQHRDDVTGEVARFGSCPNSVCVTWRQMLALWTRFLAGRLP